jgi:5-exo-hydroxycamphor dehydrogenase
VFVGAGRPFEMREYPVVAPPDGMAAVDLVSSGICGTDVHIWEGAIPFAGPMILGHEFLGRVRSLGAEHTGALDCMGRKVSLGDLVAVNVIEPCGNCDLCKTGGAASCLHLMESLTYTRSPDEAPHLHGGFAEATVCPARYLHRVPSGLPPEVAAAFLCAGPTVVRAMAYAGGTARGDHVVVQGSGPVGLFAVMWASRHGAASVTLVGSSSHPERLPLALRLGATECLDIRATCLDERRYAVLRASNGVGAHVVVECSGSQDAMPEGIGLLGPRGRYLLAGQYSDRGMVPIPAHVITFNALQVIGSAQFTAQDRQAYFDFLLSIQDLWEVVADVVTHRYPVASANEALQAVRGGAAIKALLVAG